MATRRGGCQLATPRRRRDVDRVEGRQLLERGEHAGREHKLRMRLQREHLKPGKSRGECCHVFFEVHPVDAADLERWQRRKENSSLRSHVTKFEVLEAREPRERIPTILDEVLVSRGVMHGADTAK